jgi:hypothetical protein
MKLFFISILLLAGCNISDPPLDTQQEIPSSNPAYVHVKKIGTADGCSFYHVHDDNRGDSFYFVRCGENTTTTERHYCGKGCTRLISTDTIQ